MICLDQLRGRGHLVFPVNRGTACGFSATGGFDDAPVDAEVIQLESDDAVVELQANLLQSVEDADCDLFIPTGAQRGGRAGGIGDLGVGGAQDEDLYPPTRAIS